MILPCLNKIRIKDRLLFVQEIQKKVWLFFFVSFLTSLLYAFFSPIGTNACVMDLFLRFCKRVWCPFLFLFALFLLTGCTEKLRSCNVLIRTKGRRRIFWADLKKITFASALFSLSAGIGFLLSGFLFTDVFCNWKDPLSYHALYYGAPLSLPPIAALVVLLLQLFLSLLVWNVFLYFLSQWLPRPLPTAIGLVFSLGLMVSKKTALLFASEVIFAEFSIPILLANSLLLPFALRRFDKKDLIPFEKVR